MFQHHLNAHVNPICLLILYNSASEMALRDANWRPTSEEEKDRTGVCIGSGIGSVEDSADAGITLQAKGHRRVGPYVIPRMLVNLAAGQVRWTAFRAHIKMNLCNIVHE
jgi:3-oxoacyl-(acyl-carrier-protein) synthase